MHSHQTVLGVCRLVPSFADARDKVAGIAARADGAVVGETAVGMHSVLAARKVECKVDVLEDARSERDSVLVLVTFFLLRVEDSAHNLVVVVVQVPFAVTDLTPDEVIRGVAVQHEDLVCVIVIVIHRNHPWLVVSLCDVYNDDEKVHGRWSESV